MGLYTVQGTDMGETSPPESSGWAGRVSDGAMHTAGPDCVALGLSFVINPENESEKLNAWCSTGRGRVLTRWI